VAFGRVLSQATDGFGRVGGPRSNLLKLLNEQGQEAYSGAGRDPEGPSVGAMHLQIIEGNPLDAEDIAMFEMFEREAWPGRTLPRIRDGSRARARKKSKKQS
jgi:hypothetical protein